MQREVFVQVPVTAKTRSWLAMLRRMNIPVRTGRQTYIDNSAPLWAVAVLASGVPNWEHWLRVGLPPMVKDAIETALILLEPNEKQTDLDLLKVAMTVIGETLCPT